jgi:hypothetical protein
MAGPGDEMAAGAGGRSQLRASHAEREQVIGVLKAAFVQGRLAMDEFDLRVGQALTSRTWAELAALTADIPVGLTGAQLPRPAREWDDRKAAAAVLGAIAAWWSVVAATSFWLADRGPAQRSLSVIIVVILLQVSIVSLWPIAVVLDRRSRRRSARGSSPGSIAAAG